MQTPDQRDCDHAEILFAAELHRFGSMPGGPTTHYTVSMTASCRKCQSPFQFIGLPVGQSPYQPATSMGKTELLLPVSISGSQPPKGLPEMLIHREEPRGNAANS